MAKFRFYNKLIFLVRFLGGFVSQQRKTFSNSISLTDGSLVLLPIFSLSSSPHQCFSFPLFLLFIFFLSFCLLIHLLEGDFFPLTFSFPFKFLLLLSSVLSFPLCSVPLPSLFHSRSHLLCFSSFKLPLLLSVVLPQRPSSPSPVWR